MNDIAERIVLAKQNQSDMNKLIIDYLPFLKRLVLETAKSSLEYDDRLSIAMLMFMICVRQYEVQKGNFISFASVCIKNRIIDESRKEVRFPKSTIFPVSEFKIEETASLELYSKELERSLLIEEIEDFSSYLKYFDIDFSELVKICPKQDRARKLCNEVARVITQDADMKQIFIKSHRLPQKDLASKLGISVKTIEKHRKYIVTLVILLLGDFPFICSFLPQYGEVKI